MAEEEAYRLKTSSYNGRPVNIFMQGENGPCPLLAIANILIFRGKLNISTDYSQYSYNNLIQDVAAVLVHNNPEPANDPELAANLQQNIHDAISYLPHLKVGLDVNVKFQTVQDFENTQEMVVFDLLNINLYHGWLVDPQDTTTSTTLGRQSYNQLMDKLVSGTMDEPSGDDTEAHDAYVKLQQECSVINQFLKDSQSQLTYHGLLTLHDQVAEGELAVFFRNNHFSTLTKRDGDLYLLVTDQGYLYESEYVWEKLCEVEGDNQFVSSDFVKARPHAEPRQGTLFPAHLTPVGNGQPTASDDPDYLLAMSLQQQQYSEAPRGQADPSAADNQDPDYLLALQLSEKEREAEAAHLRQLQNESAARAHGDPSRRNEPAPGITNQGVRGSRAYHEQSRQDAAYRDQQDAYRAAQADRHRVTPATQPTYAQPAYAPAQTGGAAVPAGTRGGLQRSPQYRQQERARQQHHSQQDDYRAAQAERHRQARQAQQPHRGAQMAQPVDPTVGLDPRFEEAQRQRYLELQAQAQREQIERERKEEKRRKKEAKKGDKCVIS